MATPSVHVQSVARLRPPTVEERDEPDFETMVEVDQGNIYLVDVEGRQHGFDIDQSYGMDSSSEDIFSDVVLNLVQRAVEGYNAAFITYGASGTGKGFTLYADPERGVIEQAGEEVFQLVNSDPGRDYLVTLAVYQIRKEVVTDLLSPELGSSLPIEEDRNSGPFVQGLCEVVVKDLQEMIEYFFQATKVRQRLGQRRMSRRKPHMIVDLRIQSRDNTDMMSPISQGLLRFVETAGSGGVASETDKSLKALSTVMESLAAGQPVHAVPYGQSALTQVLKPCLGGNCITAFVGAVDPLVKHQQNTERTLLMVELSKKVMNYPRANTSMIRDTIRELRDEIRQVRQKLQLDRPGTLVHDINPQLLQELQSLLAQLDKAKEQSWEAIQKRSTLAQEVRKQRLRKENLFVILYDESVTQDAESAVVMKKMNDDRTSLVKQLQIVRKHENALELLRDQHEQLLADAAARADQRAAQQQEISAEEAAEEDAMVRKSLDDIRAKTKETAKHQKKYQKLKNHFAKHVQQMVAIEERQRKTFMQSNESSELHVLKDDEDWRNLDRMFLTNPHMRDKQEAIQNKVQAHIDELQAKYQNLGETVPAGDAMKIEMDFAEQEGRFKSKILRLKWEKDEILGRLLEREFRHQAQMKRMQEQMFMVFRDYRRHFELQLRETKKQYRDLTEVSVKDALKLFERNLKLEQQLQNIVLQQQPAQSGNNTSSSAGGGGSAADHSRLRFNSLMASNAASAATALTSSAAADNDSSAQPRENGMPAYRIQVD